MKINSLRLQNFRCFEDITIELNPTLNVIIGNNGVGKTTVLDALAVGIGSLFLGIDSCTSPNIKKTDVRSVSSKLGSVIDRQPQYPAVISCSGKIGDEEITWTRYLNTESGRTTYGDANNIKNIAAELQNRVRKGDASADLPLISYYGTGRLWAQLRESSTKQINNRFAGYMDCLSSESNERLMLKWFEKMTYIQLQNNEPIPELQAVNNAIVECYNESGVKAKDIKAGFNVKSHQLEISYTDENNNSQIHPFHELSDGYRNTLCLVADIAYRMAILNPQYLGNVTKKTSGVVLIDEIDLHLHPTWQKSILKTLRKIFPLVQFIVTTHSPSVISSAKAENLFILDGNSCKSFDYEVYGKDVNSVLYEVMKTSDRPDEVNGMFKEFEDHMDKGDYISAEKTLNELRKLVGENDSGVVSATVALDFEKDWGD
ncbi:MAG: AAA family ATPase [Oscillospiraceae bacterium]|nr:AAA family ATPase [Oscillospiraceae bacterium]